jgi:hypothetical protein
MGLFGLCRELGYCDPGRCGLCLPVTLEVSRRINAPRVIKPKRPRGRPPKLTPDGRPLPYQVTLYFYSTHSDIDVKITETRRLDQNMEGEQPWDENATINEVTELMKKPKLLD